MSLRPPIIKGVFAMYQVWKSESAEGFPVPCVISKVPAALTGMASFPSVEEKMAEIGRRDESTSSNNWTKGRANGYG